MKRRILVAAAWPYVNGSLHLGHVAGLLPADILARYHRARGDDVLFVSGSDCHGTPILVTAEREGRSVAEVAEAYHQEFVEMLIRRLGFSYSLYSKTMGPFHQQAAQRIFQTVHAAGYMVPREEQQAFCPTCQRSLPDRFIEGTCPNCQNPQARGDQCDSCGRLHDPSTLVNPHCRNCQTAPTWQPSTHLYFTLPAFEVQLKEWVARQKNWRLNAVAATEGWFKRGLQDRPVTRDLPWGIPVTVPGFTDKHIYVWFEAVMGYLTCSQEWSVQQGTPEAWRDWWENDAAYHYYVHGKDNIPFHTIIWPAMLMTLALHLPDQIVSSEYLQLEGLKISKSQGIGIWLPHALARFEPDAIRFYLTLNGPETRDLSFTWPDFQQRVNGDLIGNLGNFWNRIYSMTAKHFGSIPAACISAPESCQLLQQAEDSFSVVGTLIERGELRQALREILALSQKANGYVNTRAPWTAVKQDIYHAAETLHICCQIADVLRRLSAPFVPHVTGQLGQFLGETDDSWNFIPVPVDRTITPPQPLITKIPDSAIQAETTRLHETASDTPVS